MRIISTGKTLASTEFHEKKRRVTQRRRIFWGVGILILLIIFIMVSRLEKLRVSNVVVIGAIVTGEEIVSNTVLELIDGYYLFLIPRDNIFLYPRRKVERALGELFPRFSSIEISFKDLKSLSVEVVEREPFALYCADIALCWFLDDLGFIFDLAPTFSDGVYFLYTTSLNLDFPLAQSLLPRSEFLALNKFIDNLKTLRLNPVSLQIDQTIFNLTLEGGAHILWKREWEFDRLFGNLRSFLASPVIRAEQNFLEKVAELDLRTEDRVFWKLK